MEYLGLTPSQWTDAAISALIVLLTVIFGRRLINLLIRFGSRRLFSRTRTPYDDVVAQGLRLPLYGLAVVLALQVALTRLDFIPEAWASTFKDLYFVLYLLVGFLALWRLAANLTELYSREIAPRTETEVDEQLMPFFRRVVHIVLLLTGLIILLGYFDIDVSALVTTLGIGSLAIALAAQATLADMINGFIIMVDRPFRIGDRIEIQDLDTWGDVVDIGLRSSRIRTRDNRMVIVPNSVIGKSLVVNYSYPSTQYRIQIHLGLAFETDLELARKTLIEAVRSVEGVLPEREVEALFLEFGESALIFRVRWWLESYVDTRRMFDRVNTAIYHALEEAGIELPNPQRDVHHRFDAPEVDRLVGVLRGTG